MSELLVLHSTHRKDAQFHDPLTGALAHLGRDLGIEQTAIDIEEAPDRIEQIEAAHAVVIAGVPFFGYPAEKAEDVQPYLANWIDKVSVPILGICLGHQAVGVAFGATMLRKVEEEVGTSTAVVAKEHRADLLFKDLGSDFEIACLHWASIAILDAPRLERLAYSRRKKGVSETGCQNQIVKVTNTQIYTTQFHPENTEDGKKLLKNFLELPR